MTLSEQAAAEDIARNKPDAAHLARLNAGLEALRRARRRDHARVESLRRGWFVRKYPATWRAVMEGLSDG